MQTYFVPSSPNPAMTGNQNLNLDMICPQTHLKRFMASFKHASKFLFQNWP